MCVAKKRVDNIAQTIGNLQQGQAIVKTSSDDKAVLDAVSSKTKEENVSCALVQDVPALFK